MYAHILPHQSSSPATNCLHSHSRPCSSQNGPLYAATSSRGRPGLGEDDDDDAGDPAVRLGPSFSPHQEGDPGLEKAPAPWSQQQGPQGQQLRLLRRVWGRGREVAEDPENTPGAAPAEGAVYEREQQGDQIRPRQEEGRPRRGRGGRGRGFRGWRGVAAGDTDGGQVPAAGFLRRHLLRWEREEARPAPAPIASCQPNAGISRPPESLGNGPGTIAIGTIYLQVCVVWIRKPVLIRSCYLYKVSQTAKRTVRGYVLHYPFYLRFRLIIA